MTFRLGELLTGGLARIIIPVANLLLSLAFLFVIPAGVKQMMRHSEWHMGLGPTYENENRKRS